MKIIKFLSIFLLVTYLLFSGITWSKSNSSHFKRINSKWITNPKIDSSKVNKDSLIVFAKKYLGTPYRYGCATPKGFDCSGFTYFVFKHFKINVPRSSRDYYSYGTDISKEECQKGDVICFKGTNSQTKRIGHVGIVISEKGEPIKFIHASSSRRNYCVTISELIGSYYQKRYVKIKRVL
ncbi:MAG: C40 family peptidase [Bacteroidetes bacterium]|nr:C40 family peptidase [Bacteroidota bacterium]